MENDAVDLWRVPLDSTFDKSILSPDELQRAGRFKFPDLHNRYCAGRFALRVVLSRYLDIAPQSIEFEYNEHGKPKARGEIDFNLSHAGNQMILGVTRGRKIGVDIESRNRCTDSESIAKRFFSPIEVEQFLQFPIDERGAAFLRCWVRKEAYLKAIGTGIGGGLQNFAVSLEDCAVTQLLWSSDAADWTFYDVDVGPEYIASIATPSTRPCKICVRDWLLPSSY